MGLSFVYLHKEKMIKIMKIKLTVLAIVLGLMSVQATPIGDERTQKNVSVVAKEVNVYRVIYKGVSECDVRVSIYNSERQLVYTERLKLKRGFVRPYNFSGLDYGQYTIEVKDGFGTSVEKVNHQPKPKSLVNLIRLKEKSKFMFTAKADEREYLTIKIYDGINRLVYNESQWIDGDFGQIFNLSRVMGDYTLEVLHENGEVERVPLSE